MLVGNWDFDSYEYTVTSKMTFNDETYESKSIGTATESEAKVSFNESPNTYTGEGYYVVSLKTETNGTSYEEEIEIDNFFQNGTWVVSGDKLLTTNSDQQTDELSIIELNNASLVVHFIKESTEDSNGSKFETKVEGTAYFTRN